MNVTPTRISPRIDAHVVPTGGLWAVKMEGNKLYSGIFQTQFEAKAYAVGLARMAAVSVVTHNRQGVIRSVESYDSLAFDTPRIMGEGVN